MIGTSAAFALGIREDLGLSVAALITVVALLPAGGDDRMNP